MKKNITIIYLVLLFLFVKLVVLVFGIENLFYVEEIYRALIAKNIIEGPAFASLFDLQIDTYSGGSLVVGLMLVPVFKLLGQNLVSLKLVALFWSLSILMVLYLFCRKYFNKKTAILACIFYTLSPSLLTKFFFFCMGFHTESVLFSMIFILIFFKIFYDDKRGILYFFLLGFISGLGIWFTYVFAVTILTGILFWFFMDRMFIFKKSFFVFLCSFFFGFSPWMYSHLWHHLSGNVINIKSAMPQFTITYLHSSFLKLLDLLSSINNAYLFNQNYNFISKLSSYIFCIILCISIMGIALSNRHEAGHMVSNLLKNKSEPLRRMWKELFFLAYSIIYISCVSLSGFDFYDYDSYYGYRSLIPLYFFLILIMAIFVAKIKYKQIQLLLITLLVTIGIINNLQYVNLKNKFSWHALDNSYCQYEFLSNRKIKNILNDQNKCLDFANNLDEKYRKQFFLGMGELSGNFLTSDPERYFALLNAINPRYQESFFIRSAQTTFLSGTMFFQPQNIDKSIFFINKMDEKYRPQLYSMLGVCMGNRMINKLDQSISIIDGIEEKYRPFVYSGLGYSVGFRWYLNRFNIEDCIKLLNKIDDKYKNYFSLSFGSLGKYFFSEKYSVEKCIHLINQVADKYKPNLYRALGVYYIRDRNGYDDCYTLINSIEEKYRCFFYEGLGLGIPGDQWLFCGLVSKRINLLYFEDKAAEKAFYKGLAQSFYWQNIFLLDRDNKKLIIKREIDNKYSDYVNECLESQLSLAKHEF